MEPAVAPNTVRLLAPAGDRPSLPHPLLLRPATETMSLNEAARQLCDHACEHAAALGGAGLFGRGGECGVSERRCQPVRYRPGGHRADRSPAGGMPGWTVRRL